MPAGGLIIYLPNTLKKPPENTSVFNPWWQQDPQNDIDDSGAGVRRKQLSQYLAERIGHASCLLVGEALGYQGGDLLDPT